MPQRGLPAFTSGMQPQAGAHASQQVGGLTGGGTLPSVSGVRAGAVAGWMPGRGGQAFQSGLVATCFHMSVFGPCLERAEGQWWLAALAQGLRHLRKWAAPRTQGDTHCAQSQAAASGRGLCIAAGRHSPSASCGKPLAKPSAQATSTVCARLLLVLPVLHASMLRWACCLCDTTLAGFSLPHPPLATLRDASSLRWPPAQSYCPHQQRWFPHVLCWCRSEACEPTALVP